MNVVFDLDGTLCNIEHRLNLIAKPNPRWPEFYRACVNDVPEYSIIAIMRALSIDQSNRIEVWSGRSDEVRDETQCWLEAYAPYWIYLRMRKAGDARQDYIVKQEMLDGLPIDERPELVFDDRQQVVDMWRRNGIKCCQVAKGDF
jgi:hypothetical protein